MPGAERAQLGAVPRHLGPVSVSSQRFRTRRCPADSCPLKAVQGGERPRSYAMGGIVETVASVRLGKETYQCPELFLDTWSCFVLSVWLFCVQKGITETTVEGPGRQVLVHRRGVTFSRLQLMASRLAAVQGGERRGRGSSHCRANGGGFFFIFKTSFK